MLTVSDHDLDLIITAAQSASTSSNTQAWTVIAIRDKARLKRIGDMIGGRDYVGGLRNNPTGLSGKENLHEKLVEQGFDSK